MNKTDKKTNELEELTNKNYPKERIRDNNHEKEDIMNYEHQEQVRTFQNKNKNLDQSKYDQYFLFPSDKHPYTQNLSKVVKQHLDKPKKMNNEDSSRLD